MIEINTTEYEWAHGRKPRGRGSWAFAPYRDRDELRRAFWDNGLYADAKRKAKAHFAALGVDDLKVLP